MSALCTQDFIVPTQKFLVHTSFSSTIVGMDKPNPKAALERAIGLFPTLTAFASRVGVRYQVVQQWLQNGVPAEHCPVIERVTNRQVRCEDLNPKVDWGFLRCVH
jgi:DNA-binding transcriptional regulator YdaS (Cro superfamily)